MKKKTRKTRTDKTNRQDQLSSRVADLENKWKRAVADYLNLEKRVEKERRTLIRLASAQLLDKMLAVLDEVERVQRYLSDDGLAMAIDKFRQVLKSEGVGEIEAADKEFDPLIMDAVEVGEGPKNQVIEVVGKGYFLGEEVLRPVKVKVGRGDAETARKNNAKGRNCP